MTGRPDTSEYVFTSSYVGPTRRAPGQEAKYEGYERRRVDYGAMFAEAVTEASKAATTEITKVYLHRLTWIAVAVALAISAAIAIPVALNSDSAKQSAVQKDCELVIKTAAVFTDYVNGEVALREHRVLSPQHAPESVVAFDRAEVQYWRTITIPALGKLLSAECTGSGVVFPDGK